MKIQFWLLVPAAVFLFLVYCSYTTFEKTSIWSIEHYPTRRSVQQSGIRRSDASLCQRIDSRLLNASSPELLVHGFNGGLGHKFISLFYSTTYALLTGRRYRVNLPSPIWNATKNCLAPYRFFDLQSVSRGSHFFYTNYTRIDAVACSIRNANQSLASLFGNRDIVLYDCRLHSSVLQTPQNIRTLRRLGVMGMNDTFEQYQSRMMRMLMKPSPELSRIITNFTANHFSNHKVVGIQIRTGGCLANTQEFQEMMSVDELRQLPNFIRSEVQKMGYKPNETILFLSSDSTIADDYLKRQLGDEYRIVEQRVFSHSHTKGFAKSEPTMGALMDVWLLAMSDGLITCRGSGFGRVASLLSDARWRAEYRVTHQPAAQFNMTTRKCNWVVNLFPICS